MEELVGLQYVGLPFSDTCMMLRLISVGIGSKLCTSLYIYI